MQLSKYISELLHRYECVVVPNFGGFISKTSATRLDQQKQIFYPPSKTIRFNKNLNENDGLLIKAVARDLKISYEEAQDKIVATVNDWNQKLEHSAVLVEKIGVFTKQNNVLKFEPAKRANFLTSSFGLSNVKASPVRTVVTKEHSQVVQLLKPVAVAASVALLIFGGSYGLQKIGFNNDKEGHTADLNPISNLIPVEVETKEQPVGEVSLEKEIVESVSVVETEEPTKIQIEQEIDTSVVEEELEVNESATVGTESNVTKTVQNAYFIIAGAFKSEKNAEKQLEVLKNAGYEKAVVVGQNKYGLTQVAYGGYETMEEAREDLTAIKNDQNKGAWILKK